MGYLVLVRHGQTSGPWHDRDRLSDLGRRQAQRLGAFWAGTGQSFDLVFTGPRLRHRQTFDAAREAMDGALPPAIELPELDEYRAEELIATVLPMLAERDENVRALVENRLSGREAEAGLYRLLHRVGRAWAGGELEAPEVESWSTFVARIEAALERIRGEANRGARVAVFTSAGPVAASAGLVLGAAAEKVFELSLAVRNSSTSDFLFSSERISLQSFNATAHLTGTQDVTLR